MLHPLDLELQTEVTLILLRNVALPRRAVFLLPLQRFLGWLVHGVVAVLLEVGLLYLSACFFWLGVLWVDIWNGRSKSLKFGLFSNATDFLKTVIFHSFTVHFLVLTYQIVDFNFAGFFGLTLDSRVQRGMAIVAQFFWLVLQSALVNLQEHLVDFAFVSCPTITSDADLTLHIRIGASSG